MLLFEKIKNYLRQKPVRLTQIIIIFTGFILIFSYVSLFKPSMEGVRELISLFHLRIANIIRSEIENHFNENILNLQNLSQKIVLTQGENEKAEAISKFIRERDWLIKISVLDSTGTELLKIDSSKLGISRTSTLADLSGTEEFKGASGGNVYISKTKTDENSTSYLTIAVPVLDQNNEIANIITADFSLEGIWNMVLENRLTSLNQKVYLVDSDGFVIFHPDTSVVQRKTNMLGKEYVRPVIINKKSIPGEEYKEGGETIFLTGLPMNERLGWGIFIEEPSETALIFYNQIRTASLVFISLTFILLFILIVNSQTLSGVFCDFRDEVRKRTKELEELDKTTKLLIRRDLELSRANERLQEIDAIKSDFVSIAAHQLRTPLTGIKWSFLALLEKETGQLNSEQEKIIQDGLLAINHTIELINDLLSVAHIEEGKFGFNLQAAFIEPVIQDAFKRFQSPANEKGIRLSVEMPREKLPQMSLDKEKMSLVLDSILDNAIKYTSPGGKVQLKLERQGSEIKIIINDTGIGIPQNQLDRVFTKFFRGENALLFQTSGTGLGLYMAKNIIDRHCGKIKVASVENKGTTFTIILPLVCKL